MASAKTEHFAFQDLVFFKYKNLWGSFWSEHPAFWCICAYLFFEYFRPQSIYPAINFLPWAQLFLLLSIGLSFFDKNRGRVFSFQSGIIICFTLWQIISLQFSLYPAVSSSYFPYFYEWIIIYFAMQLTISNKIRIYIAMLVFFLCSAKISLGTSLIWAQRGFSFTGWGLSGPPGFFQNSGELAIQMLLLFSLSWFLVASYWSNSGRLERFLLVIGVLTPVMTILGASSRGSQIALVFLFAILFAKRIFKPKIMLTASAIVFLVLTFLPEEQKDRFSTMGEDTTSQQRLLYWENGIEMIREYPLTGVGFYAFIPHYTNNYQEDILFVNRRGEKVAELPHNILVQIGTDCGIVGLVLYLYLVLYLIFPKSKNKSVQPLEKGFSLGVVGFFIAGQFVTVGYYPFLWVSAAFIGCIRNISKEEENEEKA